MSGCTGAASGGGALGYPVSKRETEDPFVVGSTDESSSGSTVTEERISVESESRDSSENPLDRLENELKAIFLEIGKEHSQSLEQTLMEKLLEIRTHNIDYDHAQNLKKLFQDVFYPIIEKRLADYKALKEIFEEIRHKPTLTQEEFDKVTEIITALLFSGAIPDDEKLELSGHLLNMTSETSTALFLLDKIYISLKDNHEFLGTSYCLAKTIEGFTKHHRDMKVSKIEESPDLLPGVKKIQTAVATIFDDSKTTFLGKGGYGKVYAMGDSQEFIVKCKKQQVKFKDLEKSLSFIFQEISKINADEATLAPTFAVSYHLFQRYINLIAKKAPGKCAFDMLIDNKEPFSSSKVLHIGRQIAQGIQKLHDLGIVHGDIKLDNIITDGTDACIIDFDDSCRKGGKVKMVTSGFTVATFDQKADFHRDHFALGVSLFMLYTNTSLDYHIGTDSKTPILVFKFKLEQNYDAIHQYIERGRFPKEDGTYIQADLGSNHAFLVNTIMDLISTDKGISALAFERLKRAS